MNKPVLYIIVPCFNEEEVLPKTIPMFLEKLNSLITDNMVSDESRIVFVDDGSTDLTWSIIKDNSSNKYIEGLLQSRNRGHQSSVLAGLMETMNLCDITISIDCDGQDDINAMDQMIEKYLDGYEVVYGVRSDRKSDSFLKRTTAQTYYRLLNSMGVEVVYNHADYRLISSKVLKAFESFHEVNLYLRGMIPLVGFKSTSVYYKREERIAGKSHYPISKMLALAIDGITSLSIKPIRIISFVGILFSLLGFIGAIWVIVRVLLGYTIVSGWASIVCLVSIIGGLNLLGIGIIGEYVGKIYMETKHRPRYIIESKTWND